MPRRDSARVPATNALGRALLNNTKRKGVGPTVNASSGSSSLMILHSSVDTGVAPRVMESITDRNNLEEFLSDAMLREEKYVAEKEQTIVLGSAAIHSVDRSAGAQSASSVSPQLFESTLVKIPRRPAWRGLSGSELDRLERENFLLWRREMAELEENSLSHLIVTPFEKNLEIWRQLWRVVERSSLLAQLVDARNPLLFYNRDLVKYAAEIDPLKRCLLIVNKADYLSSAARQVWADYFHSEKIEFVFFSAAKETNDQENELNNIDNSNNSSSKLEKLAIEQKPITPSSTHIFNRSELLTLFLHLAPSTLGHHAYEDDSIASRLNVGLVGYPNVGKSSTINALLGVKKVNVGATPGKTKHFQTLNLTDFPITLVDCPGLVFPTFLASRAELVCNGIMPIDQMSGIVNYTEPVQLMLDRLGSASLVDHYSLAKNELVELTATQLLQTHALMRGFLKDHGRPDESRSARIVLKDFVNGKVLFCQPPPGLDADQKKRFEDSYMGLNNQTSRFIGTLRLAEEEKAAEQKLDKTKRGNQLLVDRVIAESSIADGGILIAESQSAGGQLSRKQQRRANQRQRHFSGKEFKGRKHDVAQESVGMIIHGNSGSAAVKGGLINSITNNNNRPIVTKTIMEKTGEKVKLIK